MSDLLKRAQKITGEKLEEGFGSGAALRLAMKIEKDLLHSGREVEYQEQADGTILLHLPEDSIEIIVRSY